MTFPTFDCRCTEVHGGLHSLQIHVQNLQMNVLGLVSLVIVFSIYIE